MYVSMMSKYCHHHMVVIIHCSRLWVCHFNGCHDSMFITYKMKTICQLKKRGRNDIKNLCRAQMTIDIILAHF